MRLEANTFAGHAYGYGLTGTSPSPFPTGVSGTDPGTIVPPTSAPYGNYSTSSYFPSGTAPYSTGISSTGGDPYSTTISGSPTPSVNATSYGTVSGGPYKTYNSSDPGYPTYYPTHGPYPLPSSYPYPTSYPTSYPSGTISTAVSTGDPSASGTAASTGIASAPSSYGTSGKFTYTAPTGIPTEYYYHHKKPKRNVSRSSPPPTTPSIYAQKQGVKNIPTDVKFNTRLPTAAALASELLHVHAAAAAAARRLQRSVLANTNSGVHH